MNRRLLSTGLGFSNGSFILLTLLFAVFSWMFRGVFQVDLPLSFRIDAFRCAVGGIGFAISIAGLDRLANRNGKHLSGLKWATCAVWLFAVLVVIPTI